MSDTAIQYAIPYQGILQQMVLQMPIEKMNDFCFDGVYSWHSIANLHTQNGFAYNIPFVIIHKGNIVAYFNFQKNREHPTYIHNVEMIVFNNLRVVMEVFEGLLEILHNAFGIKNIAFATIQGGVADKMWLAISKGKYGKNIICCNLKNLRYVGTLTNACVNVRREVKNKNLFEINLDK